jgi:eukaryotic-like serine/threonine-protein kinase
MRCCPQCGAVFRRALARCVWDGSELVDSETDLLVGMQVGAYKVDALVGVGGMGRVYRAHHVRLEHRMAALKVLLGDLAVAPKMLMRFEKEAQNASRLRHPNIASVWDFGRSERGLLYIAMDFIEGVPLADLLGVEMAPARVIALARQLADALAHAHELGVIHRDFKPDNIIVAANDVPYIVDFGLAISVEREDGDRMTTGGLVMGTPAYLSPEACTCSPIDHRADLYALGVTMYELLTGGVVPFDGAPAQVIGQKAARDPASLATVAPELPAALVAIVDRLIARDPKDRYPDARAVIAALDAAALPAEAPAARPVVVRDDATEVEHTDMLPSVRRPWRAVALVGVALAGLAIAGVSWVARGARTSTPSAAAASASASGAVGRAPAPAAPAPASGAAAPAPTRAAAPAPPAAPALVSAAAADPPRRERDRARQHGAKRAAKAKPAVAEPVAVAAATAVPPPPELPAPPPPAPIVIEARIAALDVDGALPSAVVRRAVDRVGPAIRACRAGAPGTLDVRFSIGESRRANGAAASGMPPATAGCVVAAIDGLRTESAPDVGEVAVKLRVAFEQK